ncbi:acyl-CoA carboxylase subunit epsilon [Corynebacterium mendelii]|uniref:Acyl-CoA carboxylase subunit epsilon n=1 Tax=Corynebacterium mendelii TaxID=2765362 RepID=A0A939E0M2_9CORY|nr:acyl-CoA carboxylase subunit epsilon [Corynebacterium mendelii]MBN9644503.1 acyl-CoA carboxylase subunit epsilon [Corynebacterium mendelii]
MSETTTAPADTGNQETDKPKEPFLKIISGNPDDTQVAALTVLFAGMASAAAAAAEKEQRDRNMWGSHRERLARRVLSFAPGSFRNVEFY